MDANQRRAAVAECLAKAGQPVSATALARQFSVSRQIIVGDIALLRAGGLEVSATPRGYVLPKSHQGLEYRVACLHAAEDMARELEIIVDNGCTVVDVVVEHPIYGKQIKVSSCEIEKPTTLSGIEKYLSSGMIRGIGPATAKVLIKAFGEETLDVLYSDPKRLLDVPGIGPKRAKMIMESYAEQAQQREAMVFLQSYGITPSLAVKIFKRYGFFGLLLKSIDYLVEDITVVTKGGTYDEAYITEVGNSLLDVQFMGMRNLIRQKKNDK